MTTILLDAGYQQYDWGKSASTSFVAKMKGLSGESDDKKFAELWVGTHPSCPTKLAGTGETLDAFLKRDGNEAKFFSPAHQKSKFRGTVPFLLKILSIRTALSIQAHPCKSLAEKLFADNPSKYKDPNHKPELICGLTPMEALCSFRSLSDMAKFIKAIPQLGEVLNAKSILGPVLDSNNFPPADSEEEKRYIKSLMEFLYALDPAVCTKALRSHLEKAKSKPQFKEDEVFARTYEQYPDDVGCWMVYILNYVQMEPGQALFLRDSEPHAYISGDGVEIMACSDNVVRAGLTPKWKDVPTLINMLTYSTTGLRTARHERNTTENAAGWQVQYYQPPPTFPDFSIYRFQYEHTGNTTSTVKLPTIGLGFCLEGSAKVNGVDVKATDVFAVPYGDVTVTANGEKCLLFISSTNDLSSSKM
eukprot:gene13274-9116_t